MHFNSSKNNHSNSRKGQSGPNAGVLVGLIALLLIIYILFLPPEARDELLAGNESNTTTTSGETSYEPLLLEHPGRLEPSKIYDQYTDGHSIPDSYLKVTRNAALIKTINPFYVNSNIFGSTNKQVTFDIANVDKTDGVLLSFAANIHTGRLIITLNDEEIYNNEIKTESPEPIELSKENLASRNKLEFKVSPVGIAFWKSNSYNLDDIKITGYITDVSMQSSKNLFEISSFERNNIENERLSFYITCISDVTGKITVEINDNQIADFLPECDSAQRIDVSAANFVSGENSIVFSTTQGRYGIEQIKIVPVFKEISYPTYYFDMKQAEFDKVKSGELKVNMTIRFDESKDREFDFRLNNILKWVKTDQFEYSYVLPSDDLFLGNNALKLEPVETMDVSELKIVYFKP